MPPTHSVLLPTQPASPVLLTGFSLAAAAPADAGAAAATAVATGVTYAPYACLVDCANAMADAWEDTAGYAQAHCLQGNVLKC